MKRFERQNPNGGHSQEGRAAEVEVEHAVNLTAVDEIEAEVARARLSFEQGLREASRVGSRAARRLVTPALIGVGLAGGALLLLALVRLARRPPADGALIRIVVQTPRSRKRVLPALGGAVARWLLDRQMRGQGPLSALAAALTGAATSAGGDERAGGGWHGKRGTGRYES